MANSEILIMASNDPELPWIVYCNGKPYHLKHLTVKTPCGSTVRTLPDLGPMPVLVTMGALYEHFSEPKAVIQSSSLPRPYHQSKL
jgi:hypothetical protein